MEKPADYSHPRFNAAISRSCYALKSTKGMYVGNAEHTYDITAPAHVIEWSGWRIRASSKEEALEKLSRKTEADFLDHGEGLCLEEWQFAETTAARVVDVYD